MKWIISILEDKQLKALDDCTYSAYIKIVLALFRSQNCGVMSIEELGRMAGIKCKKLDKALGTLTEIGMLRIDNGNVIHDEMITRKNLHDKRVSAGRIGGQKSLAQYHSSKRNDNPPPAPAPPPKPSTRPPKPSYGLVEFKSDLKSLGISEQTINDWIENRRLKRLATTKTVFEAVKRELLKDPRYTPEQQLQFAVVKGWGGYKLEWFINEIRDTGVDYGNTNNPTSVGKPEKIPERNYDVPMF